MWAAAAAGALCAAASLALGLVPAPAVLGIAMTGTLVVYNVDRLRDLERDRRTTPLRSAFVARHRTGLTALTVAAALASVALAPGVGLRGALVLAPPLLLGLAHRRVKHVAFAKSASITLAWVVVVVGLPAAVAGRATHAAWVTSTVAAAIFANVVASNVRDREAAVARYGPRRALSAARVVAGCGVLVALASPPAARPLVTLPLLTLMALLPFQSGERYGLVIVDGALLAGAVLAIAASLL